MFLQSQRNFGTIWIFIIISGCNGQARFTDGEIAGAIVGSILCTLVACCLIAFSFYWFYVRKRDGKVDFEDATKPGYKVGASTNSAQCRSLERQKENIVLGKKAANGHSAQSSYVNSGFQLANEEGSGVLVTEQRHKSTRHYDDFGDSKKRQSRNPQFTTALRSQSTLRRRASYGDDFFHAADTEHIKVKLRGHDFTGLGFNICGNLRDGIYVQNVLQKGPAAESGVLEPGDRIMDVRVSFKNIVFEDALTILSYASPYDVTLSVKKDNVSRTSHHLSDQTNRRSWHPQSTDPNGLGGANDRTYFPLKRSQSNGDLDAISRRSSSGSPSQEHAPYTVLAHGRQRRSSAEECERMERRRAEAAAGYASINSLRKTSPTSSIRHVLTTPSVSGRDVRRQRESSVPNEAIKETSEETVIFSKTGMSKKKPAPQVPPPQVPPPQVPPPQYSDELDFFPPPPRAFSSVSSSSSVNSHRSQPRTESQQEESRSVGASSMLNEIFQELGQDRSRKPNALPNRGHAEKNVREYQTFEMVWTEGSESETSSVYDKHSDANNSRSRASRMDSGFPMTEHTYVREPYSSRSSIHEIAPLPPRSPHIVQTSSGSRLILPVNMEPSPSVSTPTSFTSEEESDRRYVRQSQASYNGDSRKTAGQQSPTERLGVDSPNIR